MKRINTYEATRFTTTNEKNQVMTLGIKASYAVFESKTEKKESLEKNLLKQIANLPKLEKRVEEAKRTNNTRKINYEVNLLKFYKNCIETTKRELAELA